MAEYHTKGGTKAAENMTPAQRSERARKAAHAKAENAKLPVASHEGVLRIGDAELSCYVLPGGMSVLSQRGLQSSIGMSSGGSKTGEQRIAVLMGGLADKPNADRELVARAEALIERIKSPIVFKSAGVSGPIYGYEATVLADVCDVVLSARQAVLLHPQQAHIAEQCEILVRGFARVGISALVYEATGYKDVADKMAMQNILDKFLRKELARWAKRFPDEFYQQIFRLKGWKYDPASVKRPGVIGYYTKDIVYSRLAPGVLEELETLNPSVNGSRKHKHTQFLTEGIGHPKLAEVIGGAVVAMKMSSTWEQFKRIMEATMPRKGDTIPLVFEEQDYAMEREELLQLRQDLSGSQ